jgi:hypothetical protein
MQQGGKGVDMTWFPMGPAFVYAPRDSAAPERLSRRNEYARQALVRDIAVDPSNSANLYTVELPSFGGGSVHRSTDGGKTWTSLADSLLQADPTVSPTCIAVHPSNGNYLYLGSASGAVYVSNNAGQSWSAPQMLGSQIVRIIVDPRNASDPTTTVIYAATFQNGLYRSTDGGATWGSPVLPGNISWIAFSIPLVGTAHFYAAVVNTGIFYSTDPSVGPSGWTNLSIGAAGWLPSPATTPFQGARMDISAQNPNRLYVLLSNFGSSIGLFTTGVDPTSGGWSQVSSSTLPNPGQGFYSFALAITPNSPGDGVTDVLLFASVLLFRSTDGGQTWVNDLDIYHVDQHVFAFIPIVPPPGTIPTTLIGSDGGLIESTGYANPTYNISVAPTDFSNGVTYTASGVSQNYNHGRLSIALRHYGADPSVSAIGYVGCQDTGLAAYTGTLGWRGLEDADGVAVATTPGSNGVKVWNQSGAPFTTFMLTDVGDFSPTGSLILLNGERINSTSNHVLTPDRKCVMGARVVTFSTNAVPGPGVHTVTPQSMAFIVVNAEILIDPVGSQAEVLFVSSVTATSFTATFAKSHASNAMIQVFQSFVAMVDQAGTATQISQVFGPANPLWMVGSLTDPTQFALSTDDQRVFTTVGVALGPGTVWPEATGNKPTNLSVSAVTIDPAASVYALLTDLTAIAPGGGNVTTPLYQIVGGNWVPLSSSGLPAGPFGPLVADPASPNTLYAGSGASVYRIVKSGTTWTWTNVGPGLPGGPLHDLWIGNINTAASPKVLLRAAIAARGLWETDVTAGAGDPPTRPYVRDHFLDQGWLTPSPDGLINPFKPADGVSVFHYQCADIKVDAQQPGTPQFFQTDPEGTLPLSHVQFDQLVDNSENLPGSDAAMVHVQVHNRSYTAIDNVRVWTIYSNAGMGLQGLNVSPSNGNNFNFWSQFLATGDIVPNLPSDSPWTAVGPPQILSGIDALHPQVASWSWTIPTLPSGDPGHFCMVVFLHSAQNPINETGFDVDVITPQNPQIGQKNLHIGPPLPPHPIPPPRGILPRMIEYVEFHNPTAEERVCEIVFDLSPLPAQLRMWLRLTELQTASPLDQSIMGIEAVHLPGIVNEARRLLLDGIEAIEAALHRIEERLEEELGEEPEHRRKRRPLPKFAAAIYQAKPATLVTVRGVRLPAFGFGAALLVIENRGDLAEGSEYRFQAQQRINGRVVGGCSYVVRIAGKRVLLPPLISQSHQIDPKSPERGETPEGLVSVPAWLEQIAEEREEVIGKQPRETPDAQTPSKV